MNDIQNIITERVDDIPLLLEQMQRMKLPTLIDHHFPTQRKYQHGCASCGPLGVAQRGLSSGRTW